MKKAIPLLLMIGFVIFVSGCTNVSEINGPFLRTTAEEILESPEDYATKQVIISSKIYGPLEFESRKYDIETDFLAWKKSYVGFRIFENVFSVGESSKLLGYDYNKYWKHDKKNILGVTNWFDGKFYDDIYFDIYGIIELETKCNCQYEEHYNIDKQGYQMWLSELDMLKIDCEFYDSESLERMELYKKQGSESGYHGYANIIDPGYPIEDYFFDENGNLKNEDARIVESEGIKYFFPTYSCKAESETTFPVMKFVDAKISYSSTDYWNLDQIECFDKGFLDNLGRREKTPCKDIDYEIVE
ncbi:MAG: hypothetical protein ABIF08_03560 [Nanoarchaeota archaeon]